MRVACQKDAKEDGEVARVPDGYVPPAPLHPATGDDRFDGIDSTVADFWRWAFSDLRMNVVRGSLAEFLVAKAVGATVAPKVEWENFDVLTSQGIRIEVKSSAYWQSWPQKGPSRIVFSGVTARTWRDDLTYSDEREVRADVFVFALQACLDRERYDPLDVGQWEFYVVPAEKIRGAGVRSLGLPLLREIAGQPVTWDGLRAAIDAAPAR